MEGAGWGRGTRVPQGWYGVATADISVPKPQIFPGSSQGFLSTRFSFRKATVGGWPASASLRGRGQELFTCKNSMAGSYHMQFPAASPSCHSCQPLGVLAATGSPSVALVLVCGLEAGVFMKFEIVLSELM